MNNTVVQQVEKWSADQALCLWEIAIKIRMSSIQPRDAIEGKVAIEIETPEMIASASFWNWGDVTFITVNKRSRKEKVDDRKLRSSDDIPSMLDDYFREVTGSA